MTNIISIYVIVQSKTYWDDINERQSFMKKYRIS